MCILTAGDGGGEWADGGWADGAAPGNGGDRAAKEHGGHFLWCGVYEEGLTLFLAEVTSKLSLTELTPCHSRFPLSAVVWRLFGRPMLFRSDTEYVLALTAERESPIHTLISNTF